MIKTFQSYLDLLRVYAFYVKLESSCYRIYYLNLPGSIDQELDSTDRKSCRLFFLQNFQLSPSLFDVLGFMFCLKYKRENPSHVLGCSLCCVCESFVRSRGGCLHTYLGFPRFKIMSRTWWSIQLLFQELKDTQAGVLVLAGNPRKKQSMNLELSRGRDSKFCTRGSNIMLVV